MLVQLAARYPKTSNVSSLSRTARIEQVCLSFPMRLRALVVAVGLLWPVSASSQQPITTTGFASGVRLYDTCVAQEILKRQYCLAYVAGMTDAFTWDGFVCTPLDVTEDQVHVVVVNYLRAYPENRHYSAASIVREAL